MKRIFLQSIPISIGVVFSIFCVLFLTASIQYMDISILYLSESFHNWDVFLPYIILGVISGLIGVPAFIYGLSKLDLDN